MKRSFLRLWVPILGLAVFGFWLYAFLPEREASLEDAFSRSELRAIVRLREMPVESRGFRVLRGLPHPFLEKAAFEFERQKGRVIEIEGNLFYMDPLKIPVKAASALKELLSQSGTLEPFRGEKKCGGFHADFSCEWRAQGNLIQVLICFSCGEVKLIHDNSTLRYDLSRLQIETLKSLLR